MYSPAAKYQEVLMNANPVDRCFLQLVYRDIELFVQTPWETNVCIFPKLHTHYGYLIHVVAESFSLVTFVIGTEEYRSTVVCDKRLVLDKELLTARLRECMANQVNDTSYSSFVYTPF